MDEHTGHTHEFDCIVCGEHFDTQNDLASHNERAHVGKGEGMEKPRVDARSERDREEDRRS